MKQGMVQIERPERITMVRFDSGIGAIAPAANIGHGQRNPSFTGW